MPQHRRVLGRGTATFLMMGDVCTRTCGFCDIKHGRPAPLDFDEPNRVAEAVKAMNLRHAVITSVNRDERPDGGAPIFAMVIRRIREIHPGCSIEVLDPRLQGQPPRRSRWSWTPGRRSSTTTSKPCRGCSRRSSRRTTTIGRGPRSATPRRSTPEVLTKSGIMLGLGETLDEVKQVMADLRSWGVDILTVGQYLQPSKHLPIDRYYTLDEFAELKRYAQDD